MNKARLQSKLVKESNLAANSHFTFISYFGRLQGQAIELFNTINVDISCYETSPCIRP